MQIKSMNATFGRLHQQTLTLQPGLNVIYAPNESGKSTWAAFLRNMLYGMSTKSRGILADKNRFAPWDGSPMQGRMELLVGDTSYTITRATARTAAPMGDFRCVYTGTATPVPGITAQNLGDTVLGIPREVFERSAFIRQSGLSVDQDPELERRIAALISTGDEDTSFSEAYDRLKKQLNARRHNKSGQIPQLEQKIQSFERQISALREFYGQRDEWEACLAAEQTRRLMITEQLSQWERQEKYAAARAYAAAKAQAERLRDEANVLLTASQRDNLPSPEILEQYAGQIQALSSAATTLENARQEALHDTTAAEKAAVAYKASPLYPQSIEQLQSQMNQDIPKVTFSLSFFLLSLFCAGAAAALSYLAVHQPIWSVIIFVIVLGGMQIFRSISDKRKSGKLAAGRQAERDSLSREMERYGALMQASQEAAHRAGQSQAMVSGLERSYLTALQSLLEKIRHFQPTVLDLSGAQIATTEAKRRAAALVKAQLLASEAEYRLQTLPQVLDNAVTPVEPPAVSREQLQRELTETDDSIGLLQRQLDTLTGQLRSLGELSEAESQLQRCREELSQLESEYSAVSTAMEALDAANLTLQNRFSPAVGKKAAAIFSTLTAGRYTSVLLNRDFSAAAEAAADPISRDSQLLSQGACDQLYFAVRMAICDLVLPEDARVPLILDDALTNFDDIRLRAALDWLCGEAEKRQILLFTCQKREGDYLGSRASLITL
ncbi:MAG: AAA family ATPase [Clostridiales bacterium]|nr:AAA family ATPase [Clostridiales bacterium]